MTNNILMSAYLISTILFILSIRSLAHPETARKGNVLGIIGMLIAVLATLFSPYVSDYLSVLFVILLGGAIGSFFALRVKMTALPQMIAAFNGLGGLSSVCISLAEIVAGSDMLLENALGLIIGAIAFSGSFVAFAKLQGILPPKSIVFPLQNFFNFILAIFAICLCTYFVIGKDINIFYALALLSLILGLLIVLPIGGADMPVIISVLNAYSGWAAVGIGFSVNNILLIIVGSIVGASGAILSYIMTKAMNRSLLNVMFGGLGKNNHASNANDSLQKTPKSIMPQDAAYLMENAHKIIIVPGYGMAVAQAQHILKTMVDDLHKKFDVEVKFAIHPVAGRMPGHMNVLLAEANVPYEDVFEMNDINREFSTADVAFVIGANAVTTPIANTAASSPIYGMPILEVEKAKTVFFVKRSLASGYSGVENPLFFADNTFMIYGDAKKVTEDIVSVLERD